MDIVTLRRNNTLWSIQQNPTTITLKRTEKTKSGGGFVENESEVGPLTVRIFNSGNWAPRKESTLAGTKQTDITWGLLADHEADIQSSSNVKDMFECPLGDFQIVGAYPQMVSGQVVGYQADLEKMS